MGSNSRIYLSSQSRLPERNQGNTSTGNISSSGLHINRAISLRLHNTRDTWAPILGCTTADRASCRDETKATSAQSTSTAAGSHQRCHHQRRQQQITVPAISVYHSSQSRMPGRNQGNLSTIDISSSGTHTES
jgi:hypothetical protein